MIGNAEVLASLEEAAKYERTIVDCLRGYHLYFKRWRIHRPEEWTLWQHDLACKRLMALEIRIYALDGRPTNARYEFELELIDKASDLLEWIGYFAKGDDGGLLYEAREVYAEGIVACGDAGDSVTGGLLGANKAEIEDAIHRFEAKRRKIELIGPELYLAVHLRGGQGSA